MKTTTAELNAAAANVDAVEGKAKARWARISASISKAANAELIDDTNITVKNVVVVGAAFGGVVIVADAMTRAYVALTY